MFQDVNKIGKKYVESHGAASRKSFEPLRDSYSFFQKHSTEGEVCATEVARLIAARYRGSFTSILDVGCGDGHFTASVLRHAKMDRSKLKVSLVEPDEAAGAIAIERVGAFTTFPVSYSATENVKDGGLHDIVVANHSLYYVPDIDKTLASLASYLALGGKIYISMASNLNPLILCWGQAFGELNINVPFYRIDSLISGLGRAGLEFSESVVRSSLVFDDSTEGRDSILHFLLGDYWNDYKRSGSGLALLDRYSSGGTIQMSLEDTVFEVSRQ